MKKKKKLTKLAMLGISFGLVFSGCSKANSKEMTSEMKSFYDQLDQSAQKKFLQLDEPHRKMAMEVIGTHGCGGDAACKGIRERAVEEQYNDQMRGK